MTKLTPLCQTYSQSRKKGFDLSIVEAVIESLEIHEKLRFKLNGKVYSLETKAIDDFFNGTRITTTELDEIKKLPSHIRDHLLAKFVFKAEIKEVRADQQTGFFT